jgi:hypothetical protein
MIARVAFYGGLRDGGCLAPDSCVKKTLFPVLVFYLCARFLIRYGSL